MDTKDLLKIKVKDVMSSKLILARLDDTMDTLDRLLNHHKINHIPIVDDNLKLKGIITRNDIELLKDWGTELNLASALKKNSLLLSTNLAGERMSEVIITITPENTLEDCAQIFHENIFHALPVVDNEVLIGIITTYDLLKAAYN